MSFLPREQQVKIGDVLYKIRELKASQRSILLFRTNEILGGSIESFISSFISDSEDYAAIGGVLTGLTKTSSPEALNRFVKETILACVISPKSASEDNDTSYEMHFCEYYDHIPALLAAVYEQNFGKIVQGLKKKLTDFGLFTPKPLEKTETNDEGKDAKTVLTQTKSPLVSTNFSNGR